MSATTSSFLLGTWNNNRDQFWRTDVQPLHSSSTRAANLTEIKSQYLQPTSQGIRYSFNSINGCLTLDPIPLNVKRIADAKRSCEMPSDRRIEHMQPFRQFSHCWELEQGDTGSHGGSHLGVVDDLSQPAFVKPRCNCSGALRDHCYFSLNPDQNKCGLNLGQAFARPGFLIGYLHRRLADLVCSLAKIPSHIAKENGRKHCLHGDAHGQDGEDRTDQRANRSPSLPPNHAITNTWAHARTHSVPQISEAPHSLIPLWIGRHSAMRPRARAARPQGVKDGR